MRNKIEKGASVYLSIYIDKNKDPEQVLGTVKQLLPDSKAVVRIKFPIKRLGEIAVVAQDKLVKIKGLSEALSRMLIDLSVEIERIKKAQEAISKHIGLQT